MKFQRLLKIRPATLQKMPKRTLLKTFLEFRVSVVEEMDRQEAAIKVQAEKIARLQQEKDQAKTTEVNQTANQPTSKKPEFDKDGNPKPKKGRKKKKKRRKQPGSGNQSKADLVPEETNHIPCDTCAKCGKDLSDCEGTEKPGRIVEDIPAPPEKTIISEEIEETKWCSDCQQMVSSKTERALPGSDIGLNAVILMVHLWITCALSLCQTSRVTSALS